jgi:hypothetical protein
LSPATPSPVVRGHRSARSWAIWEHKQRIYTRQPTALLCGFLRECRFSPIAPSHSRPIPYRGRG